jgi:hypothetical protein
LHLAASQRRKLRSYGRVCRKFLSALVRRRLGWQDNNEQLLKARIGIVTLTGMQLQVKQNQSTVSVATIE